jgi:hypothetical protein
MTAGKLLLKNVNMHGDKATVTAEGYVLTPGGYVLVSGQVLTIDLAGAKPMATEHEAVQPEPRSADPRQRGPV